ncbi:MAG: NADH-quinone oxidoreductase subunit NuoE family protein [Planctomycetota bacterium]|jgi:NADH-quinone oxidoreductase subunit E
MDNSKVSIPNPGPNDLIPILQQIQNEYGYLPKEVLTEMSNRTGITASRVFGVATFYEQFHLEPRGKHTIRCCRGTACHVRGGKHIIKIIMRILDLEQEGTTEDMEFTFETVACLGTCALAPVMVIDGIYFGKMNRRKAQNILNSYKQSSEESA